MFLCARFSTEIPSLHLTARPRREPGTSIFPCNIFSELKDVVPNQPVFFVLPPTQQLLDGDAPAVFLKPEQAAVAVQSILLPHKGFVKVSRYICGQNRFVQTSDPQFQEIVAASFSQQHLVEMLSEDQESLGWAGFFCWGLACDDFSFDAHEAIA